MSTSPLTVPSPTLPASPSAAFLDAIYFAFYCLFLHVLFIFVGCTFLDAIYVAVDKFLFFFHASVIDVCCCLPQVVCFAVGSLYLFAVLFVVDCYFVHPVHVDACCLSLDAVYVEVDCLYKHALYVAFGCLFSDAST